MVEEVRHEGPAYPAEPELYLPFAQAPTAFATVALRTDLPLAQVSPFVREAVGAIDSDQAIARIALMTDTRNDWLRRRKELASLSGFFGVVALILASMGIYGVVSYAISQRTREFGIRLALGGRSERVLVQAMAHGTRLIALGLVAGLVGASMLTSGLDSMIMGLSARDPISLLGAAGLLGAVGVVAVWVPARRAVSVNPVQSLRAE